MWDMGMMVEKIWVNSHADRGTVEDCVGVLVPDAKGHAVANVFGNANPIAESLVGLGWEVAIVDMIVYRFHPGELENGTDVADVSGGKKERLTIVKCWV